MSNWRLLAELPAFVRGLQPPDEVRPLILGEWQMLRETIILHDPLIPPGKNWLHVCEAATGEHPRFLSWFSDERPPAAINRLYVPTTTGTGFLTESPLYEGHWRSSVHESSELPWPQPEPEWTERAAFLAHLDRVEAVVPRTIYRGLSMCRLCAQRNGTEAFRSARWEWPAGFRHYIAEHDVRPSMEFTDFITNSS